MSAITIIPHCPPPNKPLPRIPIWKDLMEEVRAFDKFVDFKSNHIFITKTSFNKKNKTTKKEVDLDVVDKFEAHDYWLIIRSLFGANLDKVEDLYEMKNEIEQFRNRYFNDSKTYLQSKYNGEINNVSNTKTTSDIALEFQDMMFSDYNNWKGASEYNRWIRKKAYHSSDFSVYKLITRNVHRYRACCTTRMNAIDREIERYTCNNKVKFSPKMFHNYKPFFF